MRALSGEEELDISFGPGAPSARGNRIRIPLPAIGSSEAEINAIRGIGDEFALKFKHHNDELHSRYAPRGGAAQEMFQLIEDARVASIGTMKMEGVAKNLDAHLEAQCQQAAFDSLTEQTEAPLSVAVGLLVRQRLTGRSLPDSAENLVRFWRDHVLEHAGEHIDALRDHVSDQARFAEMCRDIIADLGLPAEFDDPLDGDTDQDDIEMVDESDDSESEFSPEDVVMDDEAMAEEGVEGEASMMDMDSDMDMDEAGAEADPDESPESMIDEAGRIAVDVNYEAYSSKHDEIIRAEDLCDSEEMIRLRQLLDQQLQSLHHATSKLANRLQRKLMAKQNRTWEFE